MADICYKPKGSCKSCPHYRVDYDRPDPDHEGQYLMACWESIDNQMKQKGDDSNEISHKANRC